MNHLVIVIEENEQVKIYRDDNLIAQMSLAIYNKHGAELCDNLRAVSNCNITAAVRGATGGFYSVNG